MTRHAIGTLVADLKARPEAYGTAAVATAAQAVGEDIPTLYRYACVAERRQGDSSGSRTSRSARLHGTSVTRSPFVREWL
jgi:hypothetical protein